MNRVAALVVLSLAFGVVGPAHGSPARPERAAKLAIVAMKPLTLRGTRFVPGENVRLTVITGGSRMVRRTTADRRGSFTQRFTPATVDRCSRLIAVAVGSRGSRATTKFFEPLCPPPLRGA